MARKINWDAVGITTSLACAIHCALLPLFLTSLPLFGMNIMEDMRFEYIMIAIAFAVGAYALYNGKKKHHQRWTPVWLFTIGILLLVAKVTWHEWQLWLLIPAVVCIITAHVLNHSYCRVDGH